MKVEERVDLRIDDEAHIAAASTVTAVGPPEWLELLPVHRRAPVATVTGGHVNRHLVNKPRHRRLLPGRWIQNRAG
ncbi:hypothetical protein GCM10010528_20740 [Gordonia defluvii]|uniref:Uncharacterized protein n=1 Tax=Gordonia defluvii TaxID=283718 RepID=A0ABP6LH20_9ACTN